MMHALLANKFGQLYADIWKVGVNLSLRISDLLTLKYADLNLEERSLKLTEAKTGKLKTIRLNSAAILVIVVRCNGFHLKTLGLAFDAVFGSN